MQRGTNAEVATCPHQFLLSQPCHKHRLTELIRGDGVGVTDAPRGRHRMAAGNALEHQADVIGAFGLDRRIEVKLLQDILLGVAAAQQIQVADDRPHVLQRIGVPALRVCQHRLAKR